MNSNSNMKKGVKLLPLKEDWDGCCGVDEIEIVPSDSAMQQNDN
jgi:hypothetical protein